VQHHPAFFVRIRVLARIAIVALVAGCAAGARKSSAVYRAEPQSALANRPSYDASAKGEPTVETVTVAAREAPPSPIADMADSVGSLFSGQTGPSGPPPATPITPAIKSDPEKLVVEAWIDIKVDDPAKAATDIRARVEAEGGRVISENVIGPQDKASSAAMEVRVPPVKASSFQAWLGGLGVVESRRVLATDVGKTLFDQEIALKNLEVTMTRLQKLAEKDADMKQLIEIENEMTRVRGQIERIKGEQRWLLDRVAFATITLTLSREGGPVEFAPHARIHPGPHLSTLTLLDPDGRPKSRVGGGVTIHIQRYLTFDFDAFPRRGGDSRAVVGTIGSALYSSFLGGGRRQWLNPYLGFRVGVGYLSEQKAPVVGGELGLEIYKHKYIQVGVAVRAIAFFRDDANDAALHGQMGFEIPF
jgi:hypothetical protein